MSRTSTSSTTPSVNDFAGGTFISVAAGATLTAHNNILYGPGTPSSTGALSADNLTGTNPLFVAPAAYDYHLQAGSPAIDKGVSIVEAATEGGVPMSLLPTFEYVQPLGSVARLTQHDLGAFEYGTVIPTAGDDAGGLGSGDDAGGGSGDDGGGGATSDAGAPRRFVERILVGWGSAGLGSRRRRELGGRGLQLRRRRARAGRGGGPGRPRPRAAGRAAPGPPCSDSVGHRQLLGPGAHVPLLLSRRLVDARRDRRVGRNPSSPRRRRRGPA